MFYFLDKSSRRGGIWPGSRFTAAILIAALASGPANAEPRIPTSDDIVLERLPANDPAMREARTLTAALALTPNDLALAVRVARMNLARGQSTGDPRYLGRAEAVLSPWIGAADPPPEVRLLRGILRQSLHDFDGALADLDHVIANRPSGLTGQALLTRAVVHQVRAEYGLARDDCGAAAPLVPRIAAVTCVAGVASLSGHARTAIAALSRAGAEPSATPASRVWALTVMGEAAARLGDALAAEHAFRQALSLAPDDTYLLGAFADLLIDTDRAEEATQLLADRTRADPLLLRLAEAEHRLGEPNANHDGQLADRFATSRRRGETIHRREEARFTLYIVNDPAGALRLAEANWQVQREPADARILLESAIAAGQPAKGVPADAWMKREGVEDVRLAALAAQVRETTP